MSRVAKCIDNGPMEGFWGILKRERYYGKRFTSRNELVKMIEDYIDNIGNRDYLQVLAYMFRFDAKTGYYLYPEAGDSEDLKLRLNRGSTYEANVNPRGDISITKHGLKIPVDAPNYSVFVTRMELAEREFVNVFLTN